MSKEFFDMMEEIEKSLEAIKYLENSHPEISTEFIKRASEIRKQTAKLQIDLKETLKKIHSKSTKKKNAKPRP